MASRMERYYKNNTKTSTRTDKNASLYSELYENVKYTNVEGIANIEKNNELDITKIKQLIKEHEDQKQDTQFIRKTIIEDSKNEITFEEKNYDLKEVLNDAKKNRPKEENNCYIKNIKNDLIENKLKELNDKDINIEDLTNISMLSSLDDNELSLDLLDDLKSNDNTFIGDLSNRSKLEDKEEMDESFYTSSMCFSKDDFEELDDINNNIKKNNIWITILIFILLVIIITGCLFLFYNIF